MPVCRDILLHAASPVLLHRGCRLVAVAVVSVGQVVLLFSGLSRLRFYLIGILLFCVNEQILFNSLDVRDIGGSMYIFVFGAFYGLGISWMLNYKEAKNNPQCFRDLLVSFPL